MRVPSRPQMPGGVGYQVVGRTYRYVAAVVVREGSQREVSSMRLYAT